jgi:hypothetical protein
MTHPMLHRCRVLSGAHRGLLRNLPAGMIRKLRNSPNSCGPEPGSGFFFREELDELPRASLDSSSHLCRLERSFSKSMARNGVSRGDIPAPLRVTLNSRGDFTMRVFMRKWASRGGARLSRAIGFALILTALSAPALAVSATPEMDPGLATSVMGLLGGGLLMVASRRRRS